jgi:uncharacterized protein YodC (DUF2158 family)
MNKNDQRRHEIIGLELSGKYDCKWFENLTLKQLETLFKEDFVEPDEAQNDSPTTKEILEFMRVNKRFTCHGYIVTPDRCDYRVSLEGVALSGKLTQKERENFNNLFRKADEFDCDDKGCRAWYD